MLSACSSSDFTVNPSSVAKRRGVPGAIPHQSNLKEKTMFQATRKTAIKYGALVPLALVGASAHAAIPTEVQTALDALSTDALTVAGIVLAAIVAVYAFKFIRKGL